MNEENIMNSTECLNLYHECLMKKKEWTPIDDKWSNLTRENILEADELRQKISICANDNPELLDKFKSILKFLNFVAEYLCECELSNQEAINLCKAIKMFNNDFYPNPGKPMKATLEQRNKAESLLESAIITFDVENRPTIASRYAEDLQHTIIHSYKNINDIPSWITEIKFAKALRRVRY